MRLLKKELDELEIAEMRVTREWAVNVAKRHGVSTLDVILALWKRRVK